MIEDRYRPVVALDLGTIALKPSRDDADSSAEMRVTISMRTDAYPALFQPRPRWARRGEGTQEFAFSRVAVGWVRSLVDRRIEVVWASEWQQHANTYFSGPLRLPELPIGVSGPAEDGQDAADWKCRNLAARYPGRPLLWVEENPPVWPQLEDRRLPADRALTSTYLFRSPSRGITDADAAAMDDWLALAGSPDGQAELRARRRRALAARRARGRRLVWGNDANYRRWLPIRAELQAATELSRDDIDMLGVYLAQAPSVDEAAVAEVFAGFGDTTTPALDVILPILRSYRTPPEQGATP
ncbi:hypothetical protein ACFQRL_14215 [Microbacterium fluvii]|uniref:Uncharacterized protein n=1 Tax=Microbacterium fluvii TaxID=415215 RepID=A0ABW2HGR7_9MICO|nr:hypothetical protein [Microbacterium fluvii]MCU4673744.1 hypothetical protein [Microbacterium fluvii]